MGKIADKYFLVDPWSIVEDGFDPAYGLVSESAFSLGNEYMGVRGYFEEGYSGERQVGSYFNGFYEETPIFHPARYKGFVDISRDMTNAVDWLYTRIFLDGEQLDLAKSKYDHYSRSLDFRTGILRRSFLWTTQSGKKLRITFERILSMRVNYVGCQRIELQPVNFTGEIKIISGLDFTPHASYFADSNWEVLASEGKEGLYSILGQTKVSKLRLYSSFRIEAADQYTEEEIRADRFIGTQFYLKLEQGKKTSVDKIAVNYAAKKKEASDTIRDKGAKLAELYSRLTYDQVKEENLDYWNKIWSRSDIIIEGDMENQQGIRFCIFQLHQTYRGSDPDLNIGAKGLSGEAYGGKAFWDTEAYCLQFYIFNNPGAARNLLSYRYHLLPEARDRAKELDCEGACYPISTIDGIETCGAWQHSSLQIHVGGAIAFGIFNYDRICGDKEFLYTKGIEMLLEISRFYKSRVQQHPVTGEYGYYGVMGVDEFHMMVNNNCFTNYLAGKAMEFTLKVVGEMETSAREALEEVLGRLKFSAQELERIRVISAHIYLPKNEEGLYEQHDGFFLLPHIDLDSIPVTDFPLYNHWSYDRIYRTDMIKQADVIMMLFMYSKDFSKEIKRINYDYYEPRCIHESSLSPSVHSIIAAEIGEYGEAYEFFRFATRLDLDNYNRNTNEGLHMTSIAAAWMNIVYGFGGMRSDGEQLSFEPSIPETWTSYQFPLIYRGVLLEIKITKDTVSILVKEGTGTTVSIYGREYYVDRGGITIAMPKEYKSSGLQGELLQKV
jgi:maltose phosphorylase